jgi:hypothetical protein
MSQPMEDGTYYTGLQQSEGIETQGRSTITLTSIGMSGQLEETAVTSLGLGSLEEVTQLRARLFVSDNLDISMEDMWQDANLAFSGAITVNAQGRYDDVVDKTGNVNVEQIVKDSFSYIWVIDVLDAEGNVVESFNGLCNYDTLEFRIN